MWEASLQLKEYTMPANLTPEYKRAEEEYRKAATLEEKLQWVQEMLRVIPKHKGTDHLQGGLKKRISQLKKEIKDFKKSGARRHEYHVEKHGAAQIALVGGPNVGKSQLLAALTNAEPEIGDYMFTTREPQPGMMQCEDVQIELVDLPPISEEHTPHWVFNIIRNADVVFLVIDFSNDTVIEQMENIVGILNEKKIILLKEPLELDEQDIHLAYKKGMILATKYDLSEASENLKIFKELYKNDLPIIAVSAVSGVNIDYLKSCRLLEDLNLIRIYSKIPRKDPDMKNPFILQKGSTVSDLARQIHHDFANGLKHARVWGSSKFDGQQVDRDFILQDGDIVELHL
jgi:ribosome-interacting GTPase 1